MKKEPTLRESLGENFCEFNELCTTILENKFIKKNTKNLKIEIDFNGKKNNNYSINLVWNPEESK